MSKLLNRAKMTTATTGTGTITLGSASSGFQTFAAAGALNGDVVRYVIEDGTAWEIGNGTYTTSGTTLSRTLLESSTGSLLNLSGSAVVYSAATSEDFETLDLPALSAEPPIPPAGHGLFYAKSIAGRVMPKWMGPTGVDYPMQSHLGFNNVAIWRGGAATTSAGFASIVGTMPYTSVSQTAPTTPTLTNTSLRNQTVRTSMNCSTTAGSVSYIRGNAPRFCRGGAAGIGGFFVATRFALSGTLVTGLRSFVGITDVTTNPSNVDPTTNTTPGKVGLAINSNTGNWNLVHNITGTAPTVIALGANFPVNNTDLMEIALFSPPNGSSIEYRVVNWSTNQQVTGSLTTNIPAAATFMLPVCWFTNNAQATSQTFDFISTYVETDY